MRPVAKNIDKFFYEVNKTFREFANFWKVLFLITNSNKLRNKLKKLLEERIKKNVLAYF